LTWAKIARKKRQLTQNVATCGTYQRDIDNLVRERDQLLSTAADNAVQATLIKSRLGGISRLIDRRTKYVDRREEFERDLAAFVSIEEYLKAKLIGTQVSVRFDYKDQILPVDVDELKRNRLRPIQVFEDAKDPIKHDYSGAP
jgi:hypothetical protein